MWSVSEGAFFRHKNCYYQRVDWFAYLVMDLKKMIHNSSLNFSNSVNSDLLDHENGDLKQYLFDIIWDFAAIRFKHFSLKAINSDRFLLNGQLCVGRPISSISFDSFSLLVYQPHPLVDQS